VAHPQAQQRGRAGLQRGQQRRAGGRRVRAGARAAERGGGGVLGQRTQDARQVLALLHADVGQAQQVAWQGGNDSAVVPAQAQPLGQSGRSQNVSVHDSISQS